MPGCTRKEPFLDITFLKRHELNERIHRQEPPNWKVASEANKQTIIDAHFYDVTDNQTEPEQNDAATGMTDSLTVPMKQHIDEANGDVWYVRIGAHWRMRLTL